MGPVGLFRFFIARYDRYSYRDFTLFFKEDPSPAVILCCLDSEILKEPQSASLSVSDDEGDGGKYA